MNTEVLYIAASDLLAVWLCELLKSLCLDFFICKNGVSGTTLAWVVVRIAKVNACKVFRIVPNIQYATAYLILNVSCYFCLLDDIHRLFIFSGVLYFILI